MREKPHCDAVETADEDIDREISDVLLEAFREGWVAGVDLHPTYFPAETGTEMRRRITEALNARPEGTRIPWMFPAALIATFRRRGYLAWRDGNGWEGAAARWKEGCSMVFDWFSYSVVDPDGFGDEPESEREAE